MEKIHPEIKILDYLQNHLSETERKEVEYLRETSPAFAAKFDEVKQVWEGLDIRKVPEVGPEVKSNFQAMLKTFELEQEHTKANSIWTKLAALLVYKPQYNWAYAILLVFFGALGSYLFLKPQTDNKDNLVREVNDKKQSMVLTMLDNPTASERMKAVSYTQQLHHVNHKVVDVLFTMLNTDPNENVRLVTLDALIQLADNPKVRAGLVSSIVKQDSELMQVALADAMLQLQEKQSVKPLKKLLENQTTDNSIIRKKLEQTVKKLESI